MKYSESDYLGYNFFEGDRDVSIRCKKVKMVKVRKPYQCVFNKVPHKINPGEKALCASAIIDGEWKTMYCCISCVDEWFDELGMEPGPPKE